MLWRPIEVRFDRRAALVAALIRLHNFCIRSRDHFEEEEGEGEFSLGDMMETGASSPPSTSVAPEHGQRRDQLIEAVREAGITRPR